MRIEIGEEEMNCEDEDVKEKPVADIVEPVQATATEASQKKSAKKLVSRTYVNDEGFMGKLHLFKVLSVIYHCGCWYNGKQLLGHEEQNIKQEAGSIPATS